MEHKNKEITTSGPEGLDLDELLQRYIKHWKWFVVSVLVCVVLAVIYLKITPTTYNLSAKILIKMDEKSGGISSKMGDMAKMFGMGGGLSASDNVDDELGIIASHSMMKQMILDLGLHTSYKLSGFLVDDELYNNSPIIAEFDKNVIDTLSKPFSFKVKMKEDKTLQIKAKVDKEDIGTFNVATLPYTLHTDYGDVIFKYSQAGREKKVPYTLLIEIYGADFTAEEFQKTVGIGLASKKANIISLTTQDKIIPRGKNILNKLIELYNEDALNDKNKAVLNTQQFINERLGLLTQDLTSIEKSLETYKRENQLIDIPTEAELSLKKMENFKNQSVGMDVQLSLLKMVEDYVKDPGNKYKLLPAGIGVPNEVVDKIELYNELLLQRSAYLRDMNESNPVILSMNEQLDLMQKNIIKSVDNIKRDVIKTKDGWMKEQGNLLSRVREMPKQEREFIEIQRQQKVKAELYLFLLEKNEENALKLASATPKAKIIDEAFALTKPVWPRKKVLLGLSLIIALILPIIIISLKEFLTFKIEDKEHLERLTKLPVLGQVCLNKSGESVVVKDGVTSSIAELFRLIRTNIQFVLTKQEEKVIIVTSSIPGEGKSFFVVNFSMSLSLIKNKKVVMVGLDIRNPRLAEYLSLPASKGVTSFLVAEDMKPEDIIIPTNLHPNLYLIPAGPIPPNPGELLLSERLDKLFEYLRANYDFIIVDTAPISVVSDTYTLDRISDTTIYLCRAHYTNKSYLKFVNNVVRENRLKKLSLVINGTTASSGYGYGYGQKKEK